MKKLISILLASAILCTAIVFASCEDKNDTSSDAASGEESVAPPTNAELLKTALDLFGGYLKPIADIFAIDRELFDATGSNVDVMFSLDEIAVLGQSMLGDGPLKLTMAATLANDATEINGVLYAAGDEVKMNLYSKNGEKYAQFPELYEDTVFDFTGIISDGNDMIQSFPLDLFTISKIPDQFTALLLKQSNITISEDGKTFTVTLGKEDVDALLELFEPMLGAGDGLGNIIDLDGTSEEPVENPKPDKAVLVLNLASETQASLGCTFEGNETVLFEGSATVSVLSGTTTLSLKGTSTDTKVVDLTVTATGDTATIAGKLNIDDLQAEIDTTATNANEVCTLDGSISVSVNMSGMMMTIPLDLSGTIGSKDGTLSVAVSLATSGGSLIGLGTSIEADISPADVTVTLPFDESDVAEYDAEDFDAKMLEIYPNASVLFGLVTDAPIETNNLTYISTDENVYINFHDDGRAELMLRRLTYEKTDTTLTFAKNGNDIYSVSYTIDGDGNFNLFGEVYETSQMDPDFGDYLYNFYLYYPDSTYLDVYLYGDNGAELAMCFFYDTTAEDLVLTQPDGTTVTLELEMSDDGNTITLLGETLTLVTDEF